MKKQLLYILPLALGVTSCSKSFLDTKIPAKLDAGQYYKTPAQVYSGLNEAYDQLQLEPYANPRWIIGNVTSDDGYKAGDNAGAAPDIQQFDAFSVQAANGYLENIWSSAYAGIAKANIVLSRIDGADFGGNEALRNRYRGEALVLRAYNYFNMVRMFGEVPLITKEVSDYAQMDPQLLVKKPVDSIWTQIEADLTAAAPILYTRAQLAAGQEGGRISKGSAQAMLAQVYMFQRKYAQALPVLKDLVENGGYALLPDYGALFRTEGDYSAENIFQVNFIKDPNGWNDNSEGSIRKVYQMSRDDWGWGFNQVTQDLVNEFEPGDPRLIYTVNFPLDAYGTVKGSDGKDSLVGQHGPKSKEYTMYGYFNRKAFVMPVDRVNASGSGGCEVIYRLADMYLLYAEALVQTNGDVSTALHYVNLVRHRANTTPKKDPQRLFQQMTVAATPLPDVTVTDHAALLNAIYHERRVELGMESNRWWDLVRQGRTDIMDAYFKKYGTAKDPSGALIDQQGSNYKNFIAKQPNVNGYYVFPVPQYEVDHGQGMLKQNPAY